VFTTVEIKPEMTGHYLGEFAISYIPTRHGKGSLGKNAYVFPLLSDESRCTNANSVAASFLCTKCGVKTSIDAYAYRGIAPFL